MLDCSSTNLIKINGALARPHTRTVKTKNPHVLVFSLGDSQVLNDYLKSGINLSFLPLSSTDKGFMVCTSLRFTSLMHPSSKGFNISEVTNSLLSYKFLLSLADLLLLNTACLGSEIKGRAYTFSIT